MTTWSLSRLVFFLLCSGYGQAKIQTNLDVEIFGECAYAASLVFAAEAIQSLSSENEAQLQSNVERIATYYVAHATALLAQGKEDA